MSPPWPTAAEARTLRFVVPFASLRARWLAAAGLAVAGLLVWTVLPWFAAPLGLLIVLAAHVLVWVRTQTTAPGGATPAHEEVWAPVEEGWLERLEALERKGARWDVTPWDVSSGPGCLGLLALVAATAAGSVAVAEALGPGLAGRLALGAAALFVPLWFNGMRTTWNPSELRLKGRALASAREAAQRLAGTDYDLVPTLALREGRRGRYPVDARLMLRPAREDGSGFLGVQVQVALNSVRGTDHPYLYAVVLGKEPFVFPSLPKRRSAGGVDLVHETGQGEGVRYLVVRQHADKSGGWSTGPDEIAGILAAALDIARDARQLNASGPAS